jgi:hypothetical protein
MVVSKKILLIAAGLLFCGASSLEAMEDSSQPAVAGKGKKDPALKQKIAEARQAHQAELNAKIRAMREKTKQEIAALRKASKAELKAKLAELRQ